MFSRIPEPSLVKTKTVVEIMSLLPYSGNATTISLFCAFLKLFADVIITCSSRDT